MIRTRKLHNTSDDFVLHQKKAGKGKKIFFIQAGIFLLCCLVIGRSRGTIFAFMSKVGTTVTSGTRTLISKSIGTEPTLDQHGNLNVALIGYGGSQHAGGYLTDAIIIASINVAKGTMAMFSVPRDMYVKQPSGAYGKINSVFANAFYKYDQDYDKAAPSILSKLTEITGIPLQYYAFIDFAGFEDFIDALGGVTVNVQEPIYDSAYPGPNNTYVVFSLGSGEQTLDGETALKYARSRHSTSDYDRSLRQQAIIQAITEKLTSSSTLLNPNKAKAIYTKATAFIKTNLSIDNILWGLPFANTIKHKSSWQLAACANYRRENAQAGCLLYTPPMADFGGISVQLPAGATPSNVSNYTIVKSFVQDTVLATDFLAEPRTVRVLNGINTGENKKRRVVPVASNTAIDLIEYGFTVFDIGNAPTPQSQTTIVTNGTGYNATVNRLKVMFPFATVTSTDQLPPDGPSVVLTIGDDYTNYKPDTTSLPLYLQY